MEDWSLSDDSDLEDLLFGDDAEQMFMMLTTKELEDNKKKGHRDPKSTDFCIPLNWCLAKACLGKITSPSYRHI
jgi:hypothetical protein